MEMPNVSASEEQLLKMFHVGAPMRPTTNLETKIAQLEARVAQLEQRIARLEGR